MEQLNKKDKILPGLTVRSFKKISPNGFGDLHNAYPHSMVWHKEHLYVGTTRDNLVLRGVVQDPSFIGNVWPVKLPELEDVWNLDLRPQIWRYDPQTFDWSKTFTAPMVKGKDGFDVPMSLGFRTITIFQGLSDTEPAFYVPTWGTSQRPVTEMLRSVDGFNFQVVGKPGLGLPDPEPRSLRGLIPFKGRLFTAPAMGQTKRQPNIAGRMVILVADDPLRGNWQFACEPHFGDPNNMTVFQMAEFNGFLYAGTLNILEGYQIWKTDAQGEPPYKWVKVMTEGAFRGRLNQGAVTMTVFKDHLYVGSGIQHGGYDIDNKIGPAPPEIIRMDADDQWELVVGEPRITPVGLKVPLSGLGPGFENIFAGYIWSMCEHDGWLYAGNAVWSTFLRYSKRERWTGWQKKTYDRRRMDHILRMFGGCDIWRTRDGVRWVPVTQNGFNNYYNLGVRSMVSTPFGFFIGFANSFGPEVAVRRTAGWRYELNLKSGLEVWLGSHESLDLKKQGPKNEKNDLKTIDDAITLPGKQDSEISSSYDDLERTNRIRRLRYRQNTSVVSKGASDDKIDEMFAFIPEKQEGIIDLGFGEISSQYFPKHILSDFSGEITADDSEGLLQRISRQFYQNSDFRHFGLWNEDIHDAKTACENLMQEILAYIPNKQGTVLDIGCGLGATTRYLLKYFNPESITGITHDKKYLSACRKNLPKVPFLYMKLPKVKMPDSLFDYVIWCKSFFPLGSRHKLIKEAFRILKPNGQLVCFDVLYDKGRQYQKKRSFWKQEDSLEDPEAYQNLLLKTGFQDVQVENVTTQCVDAFRRYTTTYFELKEFAGEIDRQQLTKNETYKLMTEIPIHYCLLVTGRKPA
jgi:SAM-dependent methyltransferase